MFFQFRLFLAVLGLSCGAWDLCWDTRRLLVVACE